MTLRMGPFCATNDPRETHEWFPSMSTDEELDYEDWLKLGRQIDAAMRRRVQLACSQRTANPTTPQTAFGTSTEAGQGQGCGNSTRTTTRVSA